eukprot:CAMPEP_0172782506 /NCGR_PEP_ID=MMETSP1074-20121228/203968_1 /TAXON_ID=2916 /ORGANISM="Ceratium fusus, Strain PA161109" /LENGTH=144 /DNA_ID=CAMNT_0013619489 /DNA_START=190 /DNA_END=624 /DNA_ORIENTATION=+
MAGKWWSVYFPLLLDSPHREIGAAHHYQHRKGELQANDGKLQDARPVLPSWPLLCSQLAATEITQPANVEGYRQHIAGDGRNKCTNKLHSIRKKRHKLRNHIGAAYQKCHDHNPGSPGDWGIFIHHILVHNGPMESSGYDDALD